jgi:nucleoside-diphosphate-sugar epimerase
MPVLVTGATGHLGPHLLAGFLRERDFDRVYVMTRAGVPQSAARAHAAAIAARRQHAAESGRGADTAIVIIEPESVRAVLADVEVIVHAAADTRFSAPLATLSAANVDATRDICRIARQCPRLSQLLFVSTACVAGTQAGRIPEVLTDGAHGFANGYERTKWEAERIVAASGLPARIARLATCAGSGATGYVHRFGALHHVLHWISRGLVPMIPGTRTTGLDVIATDVAGRWLARAAARIPAGLDICHVALGTASIPLGALLDFAVPLLDESGRRRLHAPLLVDAPTFSAFQDMVRLSGDVLFQQVHANTAAMLPALLNPKTYDTGAAERCWGGPLPHPDWRRTFALVIDFAQQSRWGRQAVPEACHV